MADLVLQPHSSKNSAAEEGGFPALLSRLFERGLLTEEALLAIREQLYHLTGKQARKYTQGDSGSVTEETAQRLLASVCYTIGAALQKEGDEARMAQLLNKETPERLFAQGQEIIKSQVHEGKKLFQALRQSRMRTGNAVYNDTIDKSLPMFFKYYDIRFMAHEIPCDIDYPVCIVLKEDEGIDYILAYMRRLLLENSFCGGFAPERIEQLMRSACPGYDIHTVANLFEPVFTNALGLMLLHKDFHALDISSGDKWRLQALLQGLPEKERKRRFFSAVARLYDDIPCAGLQAYLKKAGGLLYARLAEQLKNGGGLEAVFPSFGDSAARRGYYKDGAQMPDEALRRLIGEIRDCQTMPEKTVLIRERVHSIRDLLEVIGACFDDEECHDVFKSLSDAELMALLRTLYQRKGDVLKERSLNDYWENALLDYMSARGIK